jgi:hypothetical protein
MVLIVLMGILDLKKDRRYNRINNILGINNKGWLYCGEKF